MGFVYNCLLMLGFMFIGLYNLGLWIFGLWVFGLWFSGYLVILNAGFMYFWFMVV